MSRSSGYWDLEVKCPFYKRTEKQKHRIVCEGISDDSRMTLVFLGKDHARVAHLKQFCCGEFGKCPLYHAGSERFENK